MKYRDAVLYIVNNYQSLMDEAGSPDRLDHVVMKAVSIDRDSQWEHIFDGIYEYFVSIGYTDGYDETSYVADELYVRQAIEEARRLIV